MIIAKLKRLRKLIWLSIGLSSTLRPSGFTFIANRAIRILRKMSKRIMLTMGVSMASLFVRDATAVWVLPRNPPRQQQELLSS